MQRHAGARAEAAVCQGLLQLRAVYFHWPTALETHSSLSELLLGRSAQNLSISLSIHPSVRPSTRLPCYLASVSTSNPAVRPRLHLGRSDTPSPISGPDDLPLDLRVIIERLSLHSAVAGEFLFEVRKTRTSVGDIVLTVRAWKVMCFLWTDSHGTKSYSSDARHNALVTLTKHDLAWCSLMLHSVPVRWAVV